MGFMDIEEEPENDEENWFENKNDHVTLACYSDVNIYLTDKGFGSVHKWCRTEMKGVLRLIQVKEEQGYPVILL